MRRRLLDYLLYGFPSKLRPYEKQCLDWLSEHLSDPARDILAQQVKETTDVQRSFKDKMAVLFSDDWSRFPLFPNTVIEIPAARLALRDREGKKLRCNILISHGVICSLEYSAPPKDRLAGGMSLLSVELLEDVMSPPAIQADKPQDIDKLPKKLRRFDVKDIRPPATQQEIEVLIQRLGGSAPKDYVELLKVSNGFRIGSWEVAGAHPRQVALSDGSYAYLAESTDDEGNDPLSIVVREDDNSPKLYLHNEIDEDFEELGASFIDGLVSAVPKQSTKRKN